MAPNFPVNWPAEVNKIAAPARALLAALDRAAPHLTVLCLRGGYDGPNILPEINALRRALGMEELKESEGA